jgi:predicted metal-dependent HD superfamily phosphohydrolase
MANKRLNLAVNGLGIVTLLLSSWLLFQLAERLRPGILAPSSFLLLGGPELLALIAGLAGVIVLHELIHGLFFWTFTGERFQLGIRPFYAIAASPRWIIPRGQFVLIGLAPLLIITSLGIALLWFLPLSASAVVLVSMAVNAAGSTGDLVVIGWLFTRPSGRLVRDTGDVITKYEMASEEIAAMAQRWMELIANYKVDDEAGRWLFTKIVRAYNGDGRFYHNLRHIEFVLDTIAGLEPLAKDYLSLLLAAWFHDIVYEADNQENEEQSAKFGYEALIELGVDEGTASRVRNLILMTADHKPPDDDGDARILIDADLAPLALDKELFKQQSEALRLEFAGVPDDEFNESRKRFLAGMLNRDQIYMTDQFHESLEEKARENIKRSLAALP